MFQRFQQKYKELVQRGLTQGQPFDNMNIYEHPDDPDPDEGFFVPQGGR